MKTAKIVFVRLNTDKSEILPYGEAKSKKKIGELVLKAKNLIKKNKRLNLFYGYEWGVEVIL